MLRTLKDFEKCTIGAADGDVGAVNDLYFDDHAWAVRYLIVDTGSWLVDRKVLISPVSILAADWQAHRLPTAISRARVERSPDIDTDKPVSRQHEMQYLGYYGYPYYWAGMGMWGDGMVPMGMYPGDAALPGSATEHEQAVEASTDAEAVELSDDDPHLRSCNNVVGYNIHASDGEVGHVESFLIDDETWAIRYLVVNTSNWWLGHEVLIAPQWIDEVSWSDASVTVDLSREAVKTAPPYNPSVGLDRKRETALHTHYGRDPHRKADSTLRRAS